MTGFTLGEEDKSIKISYTPPYYWITLFISILSLSGAFIYIDLFGLRRRIGQWIRRPDWMMRR